MDWTPEAIKALRARLGYNQSQMADALGFGSYARVSELENGAAPVSGTVARVLDLLDKFGDTRDRSK